jgi:hypothetical protein
MKFGESALGLGTEEVRTDGQVETKAFYLPLALQLFSAL